jgi:hypothetical protein
VLPEYVNNPRQSLPFFSFFLWDPKKSPFRSAQQQGTPCERPPFPGKQCIGGAGIDPAHPMPFDIFFIHFLCTFSSLLFSTHPPNFLRLESTRLERAGCQAGKTKAEELLLHFVFYRGNWASCT